MIKVENLSKEFKISKKYPGFKGALRSFFSTEYTIKKAVDDISFEINDGEIVGYIGANGAGKSTTIKMMTGILTPSSGRIIVDGVIPYENREKNAKNIGVVFGQKTQLWWDLAVSETFPLLKDIHGVSDEDYEERMNYFKEILGLDVVVKESVRKAIKDINEKYGTTIILTTYDLNDIEELCNRIIIIDSGKKIYDGELEGVKEQFGYLTTIEIQLKDKSNIEKINFARFKDDDFKLNMKESKINITFNKNNISSADIIGEVMKKSKVIDFNIKETSIEDIVKKMYKNEV